MYSFVKIKYFKTGELVRKKNIQNMFIRQEEETLQNKLIRDADVVHPQHKLCTNLLLLYTVVYVYIVCIPGSSDRMLLSTLGRVSK